MINGIITIQGGHLLQFLSCNAIFKIVYIQGSNSITFGYLSFWRVFARESVVYRKRDVELSFWFRNTVNVFVEGSSEILIHHIHSVEVDLPFRVTKLSSDALLNTIIIEEFGLSPRFKPLAYILVVLGLIFERL